MEAAAVPADTELGGSLYGPFCDRARTLPARVPLVDLRGDDPRAGGLLASASVPDPCFWSPKLPFWYRATIELRRGGKVLAESQRLFGIRPLAARGRDLMLAGRRLVVRGAAAERVESHDLDGWYDATAAMLVDEPGDERCEAASRRGVLLVARLRESAGMETRLLRLARWPAVGIVVLPTGVTLAEGACRRVPNLLLAEEPIAGQPPRLSPWAQLAVVQAANLEHGTAGKLGVPVFAVRSSEPGEKYATPADARTACDRLQRDLASQGDFAGYIVECIV